MLFKQKLFSSCIQILIDFTKFLLLQIKILISRNLCDWQQKKIYLLFIISRKIDTAAKKAKKVHDSYL